MARKVVIDVVCDLHDKEQVPGAPVRFGIDGRVYQVDACPGCAARLRDVLAPFITRARWAGVLPDLLPGRTPWPDAAAASRSPGGNGSGRNDDRRKP